jgi:acyl carrier protein
MIEQQVKEIFSTIFKLDISEIHEDFSQENINEWDSLKHLKLIVAIEEKFSVLLEPEEIAIMYDLNSILNLIKDKIKQNKF